MKIDIPTKNSVQQMVDNAIRIEMSRIDLILDRFRKRLNEIEQRKVK